MRTAWLLAATAAAAGTADTSLPGKAAFVGVFLVLLAWLVFLPPRFIGQEGVRRPWWRNVRFWAIVVTLAQIYVYSCWG